MARRRTPAPPAGGADDLASCIDEHLAWKQRHNYSRRTNKDTRRRLMHFLAWCHARGLRRPAEVTSSRIDEYARHLHETPSPSGKPRTPRSLHRTLSVLRVFFRFAARRNYVLVSPASELELPKLPRRLPRAVLTHEQMERVLGQPDARTALGLRDRAMLETLYSTGLRRKELVNLSIFDVERARGTVLVRAGKGQKDRVVPIGARALEWIDRYVADARPSLSVNTQQDALFLAPNGERISEDSLGGRVLRYGRLAALDRRLSCHAIRHTMATLMLERGADVRVISAILGHAELSTTAIYTRVSIAHLVRVHALTHPASSTNETDGVLR